MEISQACVHTRSISYSYDRNGLAMLIIYKTRYWYGYDAFHQLLN